MKINPSLILVAIIILFLSLRCFKQKEHFASTSAGTLLQLSAKGAQDSVLTTGHRYNDYNKGYRTRAGNYNHGSHLNTDIVHPGGFFPLNDYIIKRQ